MPVLFISLEGIDGCGKSTQAVRLVERLRAEGRAVLAVREPGGTALSERVRGLLLDPTLAVDPMAELLLFSAARAQLVAEVVRPALARGTLVVADRFFDSTTAYQGGGRGLADARWLEALHHRVTNGLAPHRTYVLDVDPATARARRAGADADRMEQAGDAFFDRVARAYRALAHRHPDRVRLVDATRPPDAVFADLWADVAALLAAGTPSAAPGSPS